MTHVTAILFATACASPAADAAPPGVSAEWQAQVRQLVWVCYTPTGVNPDRLQQPSAESIRADLDILRRAGFTGLITYGSAGVQGRETVTEAAAAGFRGVIVGVWDFKLAEEIANARAAARHPLVLGVCVGNEGCGRRYTLAELRAALDDMRTATGKPVTTTEEIDDYLDDEILQLGDWVFPNAHPFFHGRQEPASALRWTRGAYDDLARSGCFIWFKEVGLPTAGDPAGRLGEEHQAEYYTRLARTPVFFAYFEGFDQPWKTWRPFEPHWGLFTADRQPKLLARQPFPPAAPDTAPAADSPVTIAPTATRSAPFHIYRDYAAPENHYSPTGLDGDCGDVQIDENWTTNPHAGRTCIRIVYENKGRGPHTCNSGPPCRWASLRWLHPDKNWGREERYADGGYDLTGYRRLIFWARADAPCRVKFTVGGIDGPYGDSLAYPRSKLCQLDETWRAYELDLSGADLRHIIGGFGWDANWDLNPHGAVVYLDNIRFE